MSGIDSAQQMPTLGSIGTGPDTARSGALRVTIDVSSHIKTDSDDPEGNLGLEEHKPIENGKSGMVQVLRN